MSTFYRLQDDYQPKLRLWPSARRQRWVRTYIAYAGCALSCGCFLLLSWGAGPTRYRVLMPKTPTDPIQLFYMVGIVLVMTASVSCYGVVLCNRLALLGGEEGGGELGKFARHFCFWSWVVSFILMGTSATILYAASLLQPQKDILLPAMQYYGAEDDGDLQVAFDYLQSTLRCCGSDRYDEWFDYLWMPAYNLVVGIEIGFPESCCDSGATASDGGATRRCTWAVAQTERDRLTPFQTGCAYALNSYIRRAMMWLSLFVCPLTVVYIWLSISFLRTITSGERTLQDEVDAERHRRLEKKRQQLDKRLRSIKQVRRTAQASERAAKLRLRMTEMSVQRRIARAHASVQERIQRAAEEAAKEAANREIAAQRLVWEREEASRATEFERDQLRRRLAFERRQENEDLERKIQLQREQARAKEQEVEAEREKIVAAKQLAAAGLDTAGQMLPQGPAWAPPVPAPFGYLPPMPLPPGAFMPGLRPPPKKKSSSSSS